MQGAPRFEDPFTALWATGVFMSCLVILATINIASEALIPYKVFPGNQPSSTLVLSALSPYALGQLLALFEHKVFCLGVLWNINAFDQWGVELGKQLAGQLTPLLEGRGDASTFDTSTRGLIDELRIWT